MEISVFGNQKRQTKKQRKTTMNMTSFQHLNHIRMRAAPQAQIYKKRHLGQVSPTGTPVPGKPLPTTAK